MNVSEFIRKWQQATVSERAAAQPHFRDLCDLLGQLARELQSLEDDN